MSALKCTSCGGTDIDIGAEVACTGCGMVLEDQIIVSEVTFDEGPSGNMIASGTFVSNDSTGAASSFHAGVRLGGKESKEITIQNAKRGITQICLQLKQKQNVIDRALAYYKQFLNLKLTRGRKQELNHAACIYMALRHEQSDVLLIDLSDILGICVHELGRTYLKFTKTLCIKPPSMDPCWFIYRFSGQLELGTDREKVSHTAMRIVQRMKKDYIHYGRRPSGLCGAALLMAARLHEFNRTPSDIVKIVKIHESTLRKRLLEFGETEAGDLTLEEFMTVEIESEADPPSFKASRKQDRERLQKMEGEIDITDIDDAELDNYIMSEKEAEFKSSLWHRVNEKYLKEQQEKEEQRQRDIEEGKPEKKRRRTTKKKKNQTPANSAVEEDEDGDYVDDEAEEAEEDEDGEEISIGQLLRQKDEGGDDNDYDDGSDYGEEYD
ncbi:unnamed protein product [Trichogramma brassicae]|uniref:B-related factor 1 n=1 Tax=Trichogramma brassicae TaxID=86971 RepID=A0A6H5IXB1_9HYME|nr:unnamed protein product [Trichogramma brassicae]